MEKELKKTKARILIPFLLLMIMIVLIAALGLRSACRHSFSTGKWIAEPGKRAAMTADLFRDYDLVGMSKAQIAELLGPDNNDYGYFNREDRWVYFLGSERTIIDSEWLLIDFDGDTVREYTMTTD